VPAGQGAHAAADAAPRVPMKAPAGHCVQEGAPPVLNLPAAQGAHVATAAAPRAPLAVPAGQGKQSSKKARPG